MRWLGILLILGSLTACALTFGREFLETGAASGSSNATGGTPPVPQRRIYASGNVEGTVRDTPLNFEVAGRLQRIHVREGQCVKAGEVLADLDAETWRHQVAEAEARLKLARGERERLINGARRETRDVLKADVRMAEVQVNEAEAQLKRSQELKKRNSISDQELDDNRFKHERAQAQLQAAKAKLAEVEAPAREDDVRIADHRIALAEATLNEKRTLLEKAQLRAPIDGLVMHVVTETGELVGPDDARPLITMTNRDRIRVRAFIEELDALAVRPGQTARVAVDGRPDKQYPGTVVSCSPGVKGKTHRHHRPGELVDVQIREVVIELQDAEELVIGLPVDVFIDPAEPQKTEDSTSPAAQPTPLVSSAGGETSS